MAAQLSLGRGRIVWATLDPSVGHEQKGKRPCVIVSPDEVIEHLRFPMIAIVPVTSSSGSKLKGLLYPRLKAKPGGLTQPSYALVDQIRSIDKRRITAVYGLISARELEEIDKALRVFLAL